jgi:HD-GYP domain-containing protein (c-di-GMP phosphodiesterase class II)
MPRRLKLARKADVGAIAALLKRLDEILAGDQREMIYRLRTLAAEIDRLVPYYDGHMVRVTFYSVAIGLRMKLRQEDLLTLEIAALLHDFGKVGVEGGTLDKEESLSADESAEVRHHAERGYHIVSGFPKLERVAHIIRDHHERFDGSGYPNRKKGHDISLLSRIIAVADAYDAMTTSRPYRRRLTHHQAVAELVRHSGRQFDPEVVEHFIGRRDVAAMAARAAGMFSGRQPAPGTGRRRAG